jgi:hypothetical protein|nr:MAG TPA: tail assembly chaperone protein [Caudoviricetes sp.]
MNALERLLKADAAKVTEKPKKEIEIPRLSKILGEKFTVMVQALDTELLAEITENHTEYTKSGKVKKSNNYKIGLDMVVNAVVEPDFRDDRLLKHYSAATPNDLVAKLFLAGEIGKIAEVVTELCGVEKTQTEIDEEVKN